MLFENINLHIFLEVENIILDISKNSDSDSKLALYRNKDGKSISFSFKKYYTKPTGLLLYNLK